jgi:hypothetical protein
VSSDNPHGILQKWIIKKGNWPTMMKVQQRNEGGDAGNGIQSITNEVMGAELTTGC